MSFSTCSCYGQNCLFCICIPSGYVGALQVWGKFDGIKEPGLSFFRPLNQKITPVCVQIQLVEVETECKTPDGVSMAVTTAITYQVDRDRIEDAVFGIVDPVEHIRAVVDDVVRSSLPSWKGSQTTWADCEREVLAKAREAMEQYGHLVHQVRVTGILANREVVRSMNEIAVAMRQRAAAEWQAEADKEIVIKKAEANSDASFLSGRGNARMLMEIAAGCRDSMVAMAGEGVKPQEANFLMLTTQYLDTMKDFAVNESESTIMLAHFPGTIEDIQAQVGRGFASALQGK